MRNNSLARNYKSGFACLLLVLFSLIPSWCGQVHAKMDVAVYADAENAPFVLGVASGEPSDSAVILWTRAQNEDESTRFTTDQAIHWRIWSVESGSSFEQNGLTVARVEDDFTVNVLVEGLPSNTQFAYSFMHIDSGNSSIVGRTRTLPSQTDINESAAIKIATMSCGSVWSGLMHPYDIIADIEDLSLVLHLGDYIYPELDRSSCERVPFGLDDRCRNECGTKASSREESLNVSYIVHQHNCSESELLRFRWVHRYYLYDPMLRRMRARHPMVAIFDNHDLGSPRYETRNNSGAIRAFLEYIPNRARFDDEDIFYRDYLFGNFIQIIALDSRSIGQSNESAEIFEAQKIWVDSALRDTPNIRWRIIMTTTAFAPWAVNGWEAFVNGIMGGVLAATIVSALACFGIYSYTQKNGKNNKTVDSKTRDDSNPIASDSSSDGLLTRVRSKGPSRQRILRCCMIYGVINILIVITVWIGTMVLIKQQAKARNLPISAPNGQVSLIAARERNWDGNPDRRRDFLSVFRQRNATMDNIWVSGDLHLNLAADVRDVDHNDASSFKEAQRFGVEMLSSSVSRSNVDEMLGLTLPRGLIPSAINVAHSVMYRVNPHFKYFQATEHGYGVLIVRSDNVTCEFWHTDPRKPTKHQWLAKRLITTKGSNEWIPA